MQPSAFLNALRKIHSLDGHKLPFLSEQDQRRFTNDPVLFLMQQDERTAEKVLNAAEVAA